MRVRVTALQLSRLERHAKGRTVSQIADDEGVLRESVSKGFEMLRKKFKAPTNTALIARCFALGVIENPWVKR